MAKRSKTATRKRARGSAARSPTSARRATKSRRVTVPPKQPEEGAGADAGSRAAIPKVPSPLELSAADLKVREAAHKIMDGASDSKRFLGGDLRKLELRYAKTAIDFTAVIGWPARLYIPAGADPKRYWSLGSPPAENLYALDWKSSTGWATASRTSGDLFAWAGSPTVKGAIDITVEAGVGILFPAKHTLSRIGIVPTVAFVGRHEWNVNPPAVVRVTTQAIGSICVGGLRRNPVTGAYESITDLPVGKSPWARRVLFNESHETSGAMALQTFPFGGEVPGNVLVEGGRTYLLAVVAQVSLRVETTRSNGVPVNVTEGTFNTWASLAGNVSKVWLKETVLIH